VARTLEPSPRRIAATRAAGVVVSSRLLTWAAAMIAATIVSWLLRDRVVTAATQGLRQAAGVPGNAALATIRELLWMAMQLVGAAAACALTVHVLMIRGVVVPRRKQRDAAAIEHGPMMRCFSALVAHGAGLVVALACGYWLWLSAAVIVSPLHGESVAVVVWLTLRALVATVVPMIVIIGVVHMAWLTWSIQRAMRMTVDQARREQRESETPPAISAGRKTLASTDRVPAMICYDGNCAVAIDWNPGRDSPPRIDWIRWGAAGNLAIRSAVQRGVTVRRDPALVADLQVHGTGDIPSTSWPQLAKAISQRHVD
jgi:flagellar biosynthesis protein FlhB